MNNALARLPSLTEEKMTAFARVLAELLTAGDVLTLRGEIGAGKTSFARALIQAIAVGAPEVTSPTFTLMQYYDIILGDGKPEVLWHLDLYRLDSPQQLETLGLEELWRHIVVMEWPELAESILPPSCLDIAFGFGDSQRTRTLALKGNEAWRKRLAPLI